MMGMRAKNLHGNAPYRGRYSGSVSCTQKSGRENHRGRVPTFLDGEVPAMKENGKTYFLEDLFGEDVSDVETFYLILTEME